MKKLAIVLIFVVLWGMTQLAMAADVKVNLGNETNYYLDFYVDDERTWTAMPGDSIWLTLSAGTHSFYAIAVDNGKRTGYREVTLTSGSYSWHVFPQELK